MIGEYNNGDAKGYISKTSGSHVKERSLVTITFSLISTYEIINATKREAFFLIMLGATTAEKTM